MPRADDTTNRYIHLVARLYEGLPVTARYIRDRWGVDRNTAYRYMVRLEGALPVASQDLPDSRGPKPSRALVLMEAA